MTSNKTLEYRKKRSKVILRVLKKLFPEAKMALKFRNNWQMYVAVVLSAQCTDKRVNEVTRELFKKYRTLEDYVRADAKAFEQDIRPTGFYKNKAKNILAGAKVVKEKFGGKLPKTMDEMLTIPGVGRKTANILLCQAHGQVVGIPVDTHVRRLAKKFRLTNHTDVAKIERDLMEILPKKEWCDFTFRLIDYGRKFSPAHKVGSEEDPISRALKRLRH
ncbi:MAG: hypothetical protein A3C90_02845 [Candidatus Magasanikbacteria bacterium RIFCSPHIGHO2_02_FULL_51_14]|uniref:Endonuclease III n=1 Tax=Candidatus Magasanikbacteria bacterium RIFCSPHIGHO2_02_FULL_51_14 TaxID=1798683 RepID=A0A1F6MQU6_9BACT|nr:MAG: hypothetical protein A3C90_02845 [Candidatus Magasanikbacteria bacterium RIFCSPHIGHO2_02_FULL_51_14]